jgi:SAM-dependent methyltransferase
MKVPHRWELTAEEHQRVREARRGRVTGADLLAAHVHNPKLIRHTLRRIVAGAVDGVRTDASLGWIVHAGRIRRAVPDAASGVDWHGHEDFIEALEPQLERSAEVLEIGVGSGRIARLVADRVHRLVATDVSSYALDEAAENLARFANVELRTASGYHLGALPDAAFDVVYSHDVFLTFDPNPALALIDDVARVLRPDGVFVVSFMTLDRPSWARAHLELVRRAARAGRFTGMQPRAYVAAQVDAWCEIAGLDVVDRRYGSQRPGLSDDEDAQRHYIVTGRKTAPPQARRTP